MNSLNPEDYGGKPNGANQGAAFDAQPDCYCAGTTIEVLCFLRGRKWDEVALRFVTSLRPSWIRVVHESEQTDSKPWRVTVWVDEFMRIQRIEQQVKFYGAGFSGHDLMQAIDTPDLFPGACLSRSKTKKIHYV